MKSNDLQTGYEFGPFRLEVARRRLLRAGEVVQLRPKAVETLSFLIEHRDRVVEKEELLAHLWPNTVVEESNLTQYIYLLRKTLGENNGADEYILTMPGRGYRFIAAVQDVAPHARFVASAELTHNAVVAPPTAITTAAGSPGPRAIATGRLVAFSLFSSLFFLTLGFYVGWKYFQWGKTQPPLSAFRAPSIKKLFTLQGNEGVTAISPDGRLVCYLENYSLWVKELASGKETRVVPGDREARIFGYRFSRDEQYVYYSMEDSRHRLGSALYRVPCGGGVSERLLTHVNDGGVEFSPDGRRFLFRRNDFAVHKTNSLMVADADGKNEEVLAVSESFRDFMYSIWAPDGRKVAYVNWRIEGGKDIWEIVERTLATHEQQTLLLKRATPIRNFVYLPAGRGLLFLGSDPVAGGRAIWWQPPNTPARRLTQDANQYLGLSLTADGNALVTSAPDRPGRIYVTPLRHPTDARPVTATAAYYDVLAWRPGKQLVYSLLSGIDFTLWQSLADGRAPQQLIPQPGGYNYPAVAPDGQRLVLTARQNGKARLLVRDPAGQLRPLLELDCLYPSVAPDGATVYFQFHPQGGAAEIWRVPLAGGDPVKVTEGNYPAISPDGKWLAYWYDDTAARRSLLAIKDLAGNAPTQFFKVSNGYPALRWLPDGSGVAFLTANEIRYQPLSGGAAKLLLKVESGELFSFDFSPDGQQVAYIAGHVTSNVLLLSDLQALMTP